MIIAVVSQAGDFCPGLLLLSEKKELQCTIWCLHTKLYKSVQNIAANDSESVVYKDLRLGQIGYILVFYIISFSWLLPLDSFASLCEKTIYQKHYSDLDSDVLLVWNVYQMSFYDENNGNAVRCVENCKFFNYVIMKFLYSRVKRLLFYHI